MSSGSTPAHGSRSEGRPAARTLHITWGLWLLAGLAACPASAQDPASNEPMVVAHLIVAPTVECIDAVHLARGVSTMLGRDVFDETRADVRVEVTQTPDRALAIVLTAADGRVIGRRLLRRQRGGCRALDRELVVVVALLVDLPRREVTLTVPEPDAPAPLVPRAQTAPTASPRPSSPPQAPRLAAGVALGAQLDADVIPGVTVAPRAESWISLGWPSVWVEARLAARWLPPARVLESDVRGASLWGVGGALGGCLRARLETVLRLGGCADIEVGAAFVTGLGLEDAAQDAAQLFVRTRLGPSLALRFDWVTVRADAGVDFGLVTTVFVRDAGTARAQPVHRQPVAIPFVTLTLGVEGGGD